MSLAHLCENGYKPCCSVDGYECEFSFETGEGIVDEADRCKTLHYTISESETKSRCDITQFDPKTDTKFSLELKDSDIFNIDRYPWLSSKYDEEVKKLIPKDDLDSAKLHEMPYHILTADKYKNKLFRKSMLVDEEESTRNPWNRTKFGYNVRRKMGKPSSRDRSQVPEVLKKGMILNAWLYYLTSQSLKNSHDFLCKQLFDALNDPESKESMEVSVFKAWVEGSLPPPKGCEPLCDLEEFKKIMRTFFKKKYPNCIPYSQTRDKATIERHGGRAKKVTQVLCDILACPEFDPDLLGELRKEEIRKYLVGLEDTRGTLGSPALRSLPMILGKALNDTIYYGASEEVSTGLFKIVNSPEHSGPEHLVTSQVEPRRRFWLSGFRKHNHLKVPGRVGGRSPLNQLYIEVTDPDVLERLGNIEGVFESEDRQFMLYSYHLNGDKKAFIIPGSASELWKSLPSHILSDFVRGKREPWEKNLYTKVDLDENQQWWHSGQKWTEFIYNG